MASKSKKRRRVFRASCILAALIIAGSSFAWFTSSDEVTNRLSAQADYGVSIVESFAPTPEWLPGQEVNKDVYATNTGSVSALVKEEIDTRIAITYEVDQAEFDEDCVQLTEEERYAVEAGSFLAYRPSDSEREPGYYIVTRTEDNEKNVPKAADFTPDKKGLYVFRRAIDVNAADQSESFTYDGYYFVPAVEAQASQGTEGQEGYIPAVAAQPAKYYKISNLQVYQDSHVAEAPVAPATKWTFKDYMGDGINDDGTLMVASATFRKEKTEYVDPMDLTYLKLSEDEVAKIAANSEYSGMDAGQYLVASYDRGNNAAAAAATAKAEAYDKATHELEYAQALFDQAVKEYNQAKYGQDTVPSGTPVGGSEQAKATLDQKEQALSGAKTAYENAEKDYNNALTAYNNSLAKLDAAKRAYENSMKKLYGNAKGAVEGGSTTTAGGEEGKYTTDSLYGKYAAAKKAREDAHIGDEYTYTSAGENKGIVDEYTNYKNDSGVTSLPEEYTGLTTTQLKAFRDWVDDHTTAEEHDHWMLVIDELIAKTNYDNEKNKCLGEDVVGSPATTRTDYNNAADDTYGSAYKVALQDYLSKYTELGDTGKNGNFDTYKDGTILKDGTGGNKLSTDTGKKAALDTAYNALNGNGKESTEEGYIPGAIKEYNDALTAYQAALDKTEKAEDLKDIAEALKEAATQVQTAAKEAYEAVDDANNLGKSDGALKIYIKLNDDAVITTQDGNGSNEKWFLNPVELDADGDVQTGTLLNNKAVFYYTGLLEGGETSTKLVDYVLLDPHATQEDYKNFDFDINVALKSAQINLDKDGNIQTDAAQAELAKFAIYNPDGDGKPVDTNDVNKVVKWADSLPTT